MRKQKYTSDCLFSDRVLLDGLNMCTWIARAVPEKWNRDHGSGHLLDDENGHFTGGM
jgi:hypothetical protein